MKTSQWAFVLVLLVAVLLTACDDSDPLPKFLYVNHYDTTEVRSVNVQNADISTLTLSVPTETTLVNDGYGYLYWAEGTEIKRFNLNTGDIATVVTGLIAPNDVDFDSGGNRLYWTDNGDGTIGSANLDGSFVLTVQSGLTDPTFLAVDEFNGYLYWSDGTDAKIYRATIDGGTPAAVAGISSPGNIDVDGIDGHLYWLEINVSDDTIYRSALNGDDPKPIKVITNDGIESSVGIAANPGGGGVYFSDILSGRIGFVGADGGSERDIVTISRPAFLDLAR